MNCNWNWMRGILAPIDAFLYKRRAEQLEKLTEDLMLQVFELGKEPHTTVGDGTNQFVLRIFGRAQRRARIRAAEDERLKLAISRHKATCKPGDIDPMVGAVVDLRETPD